MYQTAPGQSMSLILIGLYQFGMFKTPSFRKGESATSLKMCLQVESVASNVQKAKPAGILPQIQNSLLRCFDFVGYYLASSRYAFYAVTIEGQLLAVKVWVANGLDCVSINP